jgi:kynurenine formamidase
VSRLVDLSHTIEAGLVTYKGLPAPVICDYLSREASRGFYPPGTEFQIGRMDLVGNTGTYLDSPFHRYADGEDLSALELERLAGLPSVVVRAGDVQAIGVTASPDWTCGAGRCWSTPAGRGTGARTPTSRTIPS